MSKKRTKQDSAALIDTTDLAAELSDLPSKAMAAHRAAAYARNSLTTTQAELAEMTARLEREVRADPQRYGVEKITDKAIAAVVALDEEVLRTQEDVRDLQLRYDVAKALTASVEARKDALKSLTQLHATHYFSSVE